MSLMATLATAFAACPTLPPAALLHRSTDGEVYAWELSDEPGLDGLDDLASEAHARFVAWVRRRIDPDPVALITRQGAFFPAGSGYRRKGELVASGEVGRLGPVRCLEAALFRHHHALRPLDRAPTELEAYVLRRDDDLRVYLHSTRFDAPPPSAFMTDRVATDLAAGHRVAAHLHNHVFYFDNPTGDVAGTPIPSGLNAESFGDLSFYRRLAERHGFEEAWITNGISTFRATLEELRALP